MQSDQPQVSVIVPTFNYGRFIEATIRSLQAQTLEAWECIVVDDGSTDDTAEVVSAIARFNPRVRYIAQANQRQAAAKNAGLAASRGRWIQFLDADDLLEPRKLEHQAGMLSGDATVDIVYGPARFFRDGHPEERRYSLAAEDRPWMPQVSGCGEPLLAMFMERNLLPINAALVRRSVIDRIGAFDATLARADDWDFFLRAAAAGCRFQYADAPDSMALIRMHGGSLTRSNRQLVQSNLQMQRKLLQAGLPPALVPRAQAIVEWLEQLAALQAAVDQHVPPGEPFILVDEGKLGAEMSGYRCRAFPEAGGTFGGTPASDADAVEALEALQREGVRFVVVAWPAMWYLEHYAQWGRRLMSSAVLHREASHLICRLGDA